MRKCHQLPTTILFWPTYDWIHCKLWGLEVIWYETSSSVNHDSDLRLGGIWKWTWWARYVRAEACVASLFLTPSYVELTVFDYRCLNLWLRWHMIKVFIKPMPTLNNGVPILVTQLTCRLGFQSVSLSPMPLPQKYLPRPRKYW